jgi:GNAT superfamily N-acetyltransferase
LIAAPNLPTLQLIELHINTLFRCDAAGRLLCVNEAGEPPAPLFYMGRTSQGNFWRFRHDLLPALVEEIDDLCRSEPVTDTLTNPLYCYSAIRARLNSVVPFSSQREFRGPAYYIPDGAGRDHPRAAEVVTISEVNVHLVQNTFDWLVPLDPAQEIAPILAAVEGAQAVSICFCSRRPAQATEAGLETLPAFRGKGYATATVAAWAAAVRQRSCIPLYSTSWDNLASQAVARKLGMVIYGEDWSIR